MAPASEGEKNGGGRSVSASRWGGGEYCARCGKQVFLAERRQGAGNVRITLYKPALGLKGVQCHHEVVALNTLLIPKLVSVILTFTQLSTTIVGFNPFY